MTANSGDKNMNSEYMPTITLTTTDHAFLRRYDAEAGGRLRSTLEFLAREIERAEIVPPERIGPEIVRLGSIVTFRELARGKVMQRRLAPPSHGPLREEDLSIFTPVGVALIGLSVGQKMSWKTRDGRVLALEVLKVLNPLESVKRIQNI